MGVLQEPCKRCGHAFSFHSKSSTQPCKAIGCHAGKARARCPGFVPTKNASAELREALSASA